jgi:exoribonuclease-2
MIETKPTVNSLVLYKIRPARVVAVDDKIEIELAEGKNKRVRPKDLSLLHPGPLHRLTDLTPRSGEIQEAWELLTGSETDLQELAELIFDDYTPATAWAAWELVAEGLYFEGSPQQVRAREAEQVAADQAAQAAKEAEQQAWEGFLQRLDRGSLVEQDRDRLREVEMLALGQRENSRILRQLGHQESRENAHRLLVSVGYWERAFNPYPGRIGLPLQDPAIELPELPEEARRDLTGLPAFAIDDQDNQDPDDALSLDGDRIWVHVADVAALVPPGSNADLEARARGANLYLPERIVPMLPPRLTERLGLGLHPESPALSVSFRLDADGTPQDVELTASRVRVQRLSYDEVDQLLDEAPFRQMSELGRRFRQRRQAAGAIGLELPEVMVRVRDGKVVVRPLPRLGSREMVTDCMLMAGEAVARFAEERGLAVPFAGQPAPETRHCPDDLAGMYAFRRQLKPSQLSTQPEPHAGLGLARYTRATSPLRRYSDLLAHQQLRAWLAGRTPLGTDELSQRLAVSETAGAGVRRAERLSNQHWKLVYLQQNPDWRGDGVVVDLNDGRGVVLIPELALETRVRFPSGVSLNDQKRLILREVDLPDLTVRFRVRD